MIYASHLQEGPFWPVPASCLAPRAALPSGQRGAVWWQPTLDHAPLLPSIVKTYQKSIVWAPCSVQYLVLHHNKHDKVSKVWLYAKDSMLVHSQHSETACKLQELKVGLQAAYTAWEITAWKISGKCLMGNYLQDQLILSYLIQRVGDVRTELILPPESKLL